MSTRNPYEFDVASPEKIRGLAGGRPALSPNEYVGRDKDPYRYEYMGTRAFLAVACFCALTCLVGVVMIVSDSAEGAEDTEVCSGDCLNSLCDGVLCRRCPGTGCCLARNFGGEMYEGHCTERSRTLLYIGIVLCGCSGVLLLCMLCYSCASGMCGPVFDYLFYRPVDQIRKRRRGVVITANQNNDPASAAGMSGMVMSPSVAASVDRGHASPLYPPQFQMIQSAQMAPPSIQITPSAQLSAQPIRQMPPPAAPIIFGSSKKPITISTPADTPATQVEDVVHGAAARGVTPSDILAYLRAQGEGEGEGTTPPRGEGVGRVGGEGRPEKVVRTPQVFSPTSTPGGMTPGMLAAEPASLTPMRTPMSPETTGSARVRRNPVKVVAPEEEGRGGGSGGGGGAARIASPSPPRSASAVSPTLSRSYHDAPIELFVVE